MPEYQIHFDNVGKSYNVIRVIDRLSLGIRPGEFMSLLGPSGSGKTTLLMMLAGFEDVTDGTILVNGTVINNTPVHKRNMGVVFQNYALFPHMSVGENIAFPLKMRRVGRAEIEQRVKRALDMVQLSSMVERKPQQLSGGQQQRVALARALIFEPRVVLMDEPLGALDKQLREQMQLDIRDLHRRLGLTIVFVTHDQSEALTMSDRIAVFNRGAIEQVGTPREIYDRPQTRFVAEFIGETNLLAGKVTAVTGNEAEVLLNDGPPIRVSSDNLGNGREVLVSIRPERIALARTASGSNALSMQLVDTVYQGDHMRATLVGEGLKLTARLGRSREDWVNGANTTATFDPRDCWMIAS